MGSVVFVAGGTRSGKSTFAQSRAEAAGPNRLFVATLVPGDDEMNERVLRHRAMRGEGWEVLEEPLEVASAMPAAIKAGTDSVLLDCLTLWLTNILADGRDPEDEFKRLCDALLLCSRQADVFVVTNEVGMGIVPANALAREFRDQAGLLNQQVAAIADEAYMVVSGIPMRLK